MNGVFWVIIYVRSPPHQYGPFHIPEDAAVGTTVTAVLAGDADVRGGDSWQVDYQLESGNEEEVFTLMTDKQTNEVSLILSKVLNTDHTPTSKPTQLTTSLIIYTYSNISLTLTSGPN